MSVETKTNRSAPSQVAAIVVSTAASSDVSTLIPHEVEMISVKLEFDWTRTIDSLPPSLRLLHFGDDETDPSRRYAFSERALAERFFKGRTTGFLLFGPSVEGLATVSPRKSMLLSFTVAGTPDLARHFLTHMASAQPLFGFACDPDESHCWNRVQAEFGINSMDSWVGRDIGRYIPGL